MEETQEVERSERPGEELLEQGKSDPLSQILLSQMGTENSSLELAEWSFLLTLPRIFTYV